MLCFCSVLGFNLCVSQLFPSVVEHYGKCMSKVLKPGEECVLLIDSAEVHLSSAALEMAKKYHVNLVSLIKNSTGDTQALDKVYSGPWQRCLRKEKENHIYQFSASKGILQSIEKADVVRLGTKSWHVIDTAANRAAAFSSTGIFPLNPHVFDHIWKLRASQSATSSPPPLITAPPPAVAVSAAPPPALPSRYARTGLIFFVHVVRLTWFHLLFLFVFCNRQLQDYTILDFVFLPIFQMETACFVQLDLLSMFPLLISERKSLIR